MDGRRITDNIGLKILALFLSIALWMAVVNIDDPSVRKSMTISVTMKHQEYITNMGKYLDILGDSNTITFSYTTKRSVWENLSASDFSATADLEKIEAKEDGTYRVPVSVNATRNANQITIETKQMYLNVSLEDLGKKQFQIKANTSGMVADGCALGNVEIESANVVQVSGPVSVVNAIDSVIATVNVAGMSTDITDNVVPVFYDADGEVIDTTKLETSVETVRISAQILNTKDVPLSFSTMGTLPEGYQLLKISSDPAVVRVKGVAATLNTLDKIVIPPEVLDLTDATSSIEKTIDISTYLPSGVSLVISPDAKVKVLAEIEPIETKEYQVPVSNITAEGLKKGYRISHKEDVIFTDISASKSALDALNAADIKGSISVENLSVGTHRVPVVLDLDEAVYSASDIFAEVQVILAEGNNGDSENAGTEEGGETEEESTPDQTVPDDSAQTESEAENSTQADSIVESE